MHSRFGVIVRASYAPALSRSSNRRGPRSDPEAHLRSMRSVRTSYFKSPVERRSLATPLPRVQGAKEHLRTTVGKLSTHTHECRRCGMKWECGEANYQDECPYPIKTLCTKCWAQAVPKTPLYLGRSNQRKLEGGRSCPRELAGGIHHRRTLYRDQRYCLCGRVSGGLYPSSKGPHL